jgi:hypothetical protein
MKYTVLFSYKYVGTETWKATVFAPSEAEAINMVRSHLQSGARPEDPQFHDCEYIETGIGDIEIPK